MFNIMVIIKDYLKIERRLSQVHGTYILDGNSEMGPHVRRNICYVISLGREQSQIEIAPERPIFLHACATCSELPSNISTMRVPVSPVALLYFVFNQIIFPWH